VEGSECCNALPYFLFRVKHCVQKFIGLSAPTLLVLNENRRKEEEMLTLNMVLKKMLVFSPIPASMNEILHSIDI